VFIIGLDLGQKQDYTAVAVVEKENRAGDKPMLYLRHLERFALGTPYAEQMDRVKEIVGDEKLWVKKRVSDHRTVTWLPELIVDATGVGLGVVEMLKDRGLGYRAVTITGGFSEAFGTGTYHVPKRNLVSRAVAPFEGKRLKIARGMRLTSELVRELENFKVKVSTQTAHDSYEAGREADHDDLVLALALACWWVERRQPRLRLTAKPAGL
jgi:Terminase RNaseH-like domain